MFKLIPKWVNHIRGNENLEDDNIFLHEQERNLNERLGEQGSGVKTFAHVCHMPTKGDTMVIEFHNWLRKYANGGPWGKDVQYPPRLEREHLLERYNSHTKHCKSCQGAYRNIVLFRKILFGIAALNFSFTPYLLAVSIRPSYLAFSGCFSILSVLLNLRLKKTEQQFIQGQYPPPRNRKPSMLKRML